MKIKYKGENPICQQLRDLNPGFTGEYHPACCRFPKSCSSGVYEFYPEDAVEQPKRVRVFRVKGVGPGTMFDWAVYGLHPTASSTITLFKYFASAEEAYSFVDRAKDWRQVLIEEGFLV